MTLTTWLLLCGTWAIALTTPGPDIFLLLRLGARDRMAAVRAALGIMTGNTLWVLAAVLGLAALLATLPLALPVLQALGSTVLIILGVQALRGGISQLRRCGEETSVSGTVRRPWLLGLVTNLSNPKAIIFFSALITQFLPAQPTTGDKIAIAVVLIGTGLAWFLGLALAASARVFRERFRRAAPILDIVAGIVFIIVAATILIGLGTRALG